MPKKKKKSKASLGGGDTSTPPLTTSTPQQPTQQSTPCIVEDILRVSIVPSSSPPIKSLKYAPQIVLTEQDADRLDIQNGEQVFVVAATTTSTTNDAASSALDIKTVALTTVHILKSSLKSPRGGGEGKVGPSKSKLSNSGQCHIFPVSLAQHLTGNAEDYSNTASTISTTTTSIPKTPSTPLVATPKSYNSASKSKFSFASGGGGDLLLTPQSPAPSTPQTKKTPRSSSVPLQRQIYIVPLDSEAGTRLETLLCREAKTLVFHDGNQNELSASSLGPRLVLAHTSGAHLTMSTKTIPISFRGQLMDCTLERIAGLTPTQEDDGIDASTSVQELSSGLKDLSLDDKTPHELVDNILSTIRSLSADDRQHLFLYQVTSTTTVKFESPNKENQTITANVLAHPTSKFVAGLDTIVQQVETMLSTPFLHPELFQGALRPPRGVLLHGPGGVGKSCLARQIAANLQDRVGVNVTHVNCTSLQAQTAIVGQAEEQLSNIFQLAEQRPLPTDDGGNQLGSLLVLDDVHLICPKRRGTDPGADRLAATLLALLDGIAGQGPQREAKATVMILAITSNPSLLDPALRRPGRLDAEVEVPLPDEPGTRCEILKFQLEKMQGHADFSDKEWLSLARLAKGFTGADCQLAVKEALRYAVQELGETSKEDNSIKVRLEQFQRAIRTTKPSAIKAVTVEIPQVHWSSIGGMDQVKKELKEAIELPVTHGHIFRKLNIRPPRGVLLYGPPGCSKTLMARALATEGHMNFLAVKGPELLSKWLGESERALSSLFKRARLAAPSVIFFDEIDAIATKRSGASSGGERLLSQLLTELDGVQNRNDAKQRVVVVGATNRPDIIDSALLRPGRIDRMIYVGVPDEQSRAGIFQLSLKDKACADDIDIEALANDRISGGLSGAEVVSACRNAALMALEEDDETHGDGQSMPIIRMSHLQHAVESLERQITPEMLEFYDSYRGKSIS